MHTTLGLPTSWLCLRERTHFQVVPVNYNGTITGTKRLDQPVLVLGDFNPTTVNGINLAELVPRILTKHGDQSILGNYTFNSDITAGTICVCVIINMFLPLEVHNSKLSTCLDSK